MDPHRSCSADMQDEKKKKKTKKKNSAPSVKEKGGFVRPKIEARRKPGGKGGVGRPRSLTLDKATKSLGG